jgi:hypothetical protein
VSAFVVVAARLISAGGGAAYRLGSTRPAQIRIGPKWSPRPGRWPTVQLFVVAWLFLAALALSDLARRNQGRALLDQPVVESSSPDPAGVLAVALIALSAWLLLGTLCGYIVFAESRASASLPVLPPARSHVRVRVSGLIRSNSLGLVRVREAGAVLGFAQGRRDSMVIRSPGYEAIPIDGTAGVSARPGTAFVLRGGMQAIRLSCGGRQLILTFGHVSARDEWLAAAHRLGLTKA